MLDYPMAVSSDHDLADATACVAQVLGLPRTTAGTLAVGALSALVTSVDHPITAQVYRELLGEPATCRVLWSVDNKLAEPAYLDARRLLAVSAARVSYQLDARTCLTFQLDRVVMRRRGGVLLLNDWFPEWSDAEVLALLPRPFDVVADEGRL
jgi:hypothetical protein